MSSNTYNSKTVRKGLASSSSPQRKPTRLKEFDYAGVNMVFFATLCCLGKRKAFVNDDFNSDVLECVEKEKNRIGHAVYAYCCT